MTNSSESSEDRMHKFQLEKNPSFEFGTAQMKDLLKSGQNRLKNFFVIKTKTEGSLFSKSARSRDVIECRCKSSDAKILESYEYKKVAHFRARVTNKFEDSGTMMKLNEILRHEGPIVVHYGKVWSLWTPSKPSEGSMNGLQTVKALCLEGHPVAIWRYWQLKEEALNLLSASGYVQVWEEQKEDGDVVKYPNYLLFLLICTPKDLDSLENLCESGKDLLLSPFLVEKGADLLKRCNYSQVSPSSLDSDLIHFRIFHSRKGKLKFKPLLGRKPIQMKDYIKLDWFEGKSKIDGVLPNNQSVLVNLVLQPQLRHEGGKLNVFFTLTVPNLSVDVEKSIASAVKDDWKCFLDSIKLTLKPLWLGSEYLVPTIKVNKCNRDMVKVINTTSGMHKLIVMRRKANDSIKKVIESAGAAGVEWKPDYSGVWHGGYDLYDLIADPDRYGRLCPESPDLNDMLEVEWALDKKREEMVEGKEMSVEVRLDVGIQCFANTLHRTHFVCSPQLKVEEFCFSATLNFTLPSILSSSASVMHTQQEINEEAFEVYSEIKQEICTPFSESFTPEHAKDEKIEDLEGCWATLEFSSSNSETKRIKYVKSSRKVVDSLTDASPFFYFSDVKSMTDFLGDKDLMTRCKGLWLDFPLQAALAIELGIALDGPLSNLVYLDLSHTGKEFSFLWKHLSKPSSRLLYLDLSNNPMHIEPFLASWHLDLAFPCVQHLDLSNTQCHYHTISFLSWLFPDLHYLNLSNNNIDNWHAYQMNNWPSPSFQLRHLDLSNNPLLQHLGVIGVIEVIPRVLSLNLQGNDFNHEDIRILTQVMARTPHLLLLRL